MEVEFPMLFSITNQQSGRKTHAGVLEFVADEGLCHMPKWMMQNLVMGEGDRISVENVKLPVATFAKFQPQSPDFLDLSDHKAVLERSLRTFSCLTEGDIIAINYMSKIFEIVVLELKPAKAVSIVECDLELDFAPPVGYVEPVRVPLPSIGGNAEGPNAYSPEKKAEEDIKKIEEEEAALIEKSVFQAFTGTGRRLDGKATKQKEFAPVTTGVGVTTAEEEEVAKVKAAATAALDHFKLGKFSFTLNSAAAAKRTADAADGTVGGGGAEGEDGDDSGNPFASFAGSSRSLR
jgi:ubiquitin fusion degradation protein 1